MIRLNKKGISPLIATVLLIGSTIVIASLLILWWSGTVKDTIQKEGIANKGKTLCLGEVGIDVVSCNDELPQRTVTVMNTGSAPITAFRFVTDDGTTTREDEIKPSKQKSLNVDSTDNLKIIPVVVVEGYPVTCSEKLVEVTNC